MNDDVSRLRELLAKGTRGPWRIGLEGDNTGWPESSVWSAEDDCVGECYRNASEADAALIVAAVNALPKLLDVVEAARKVEDYGHGEYCHAISGIWYEEDQCSCGLRELRAALSETAP
jgi:hypothetical protein